MTTSTIAAFTDVYLKVDDLPNSLVFPGPALLPPEHYASAQAILVHAQQYTIDDFVIEHEGRIWRVRRDRRTIDGLWLRLRRMPEVAPNLDQLESPLPGPIRSMLMSPMLVAGGLIYICGTAGSGKTTTASATLISRLQHYGGVAYTIEDPPEMPMNGWHGNGYCSQTEVAGESSDDWMESFRCALRSQPAATGQILFVGEVRNRESAQMMLRAAANGFLVISTGFGADVVSGVQALQHLVGEEAVNMLASMLRLILHQRLDAHRHLQVKALASSHGMSSVASRIRANKTMFLTADQEEQEHIMLRGASPLEVQQQQPL